MIVIVFADNLVGPKQLFESWLNSLPGYVTSTVSEIPHLLVWMCRPDVLSSREAEKRPRVKMSVI